LGARSNSQEQARAAPNQKSRYWISHCHHHGCPVVPDSATRWGGGDITLVVET
jgi:hypothetical protein